MSSFSMHARLEQLVAALTDSLNQHWPTALEHSELKQSCVSVEVDATYLKPICAFLYHEKPFDFKMLVDLCGTDYQTFGQSEWTTDEATHTGFERGIHTATTSFLDPNPKKNRFAVDYQFLSLSHNHRLHLRTFTQEDVESGPFVDSVTDIWDGECTKWYEREAYDLFGISFKGNPDPRRILTDYNFKGHPFRKDFPLIGYEEVRYDADQEQVIYEPVTSVTPRTLVPKVIRVIEKEANHE